ncbi:hypothetical protein GLAREA_00421 [Glarea lozoyensis ATCC 20868]|uniref:Uncharacterized protein n=1 Tax=Glarea lozoyensis (strain ATCC 20868 / MF5171) TaxID=1116229 RepID=S3DBD7_GLAL2|nr:uncharacterized protein GLAREA_00421 [Glarea lozoyensis ATCC 20868]EPE29261.1 hypothetical protein GLAREA_00421 [Glarea lozoyensis ATCC 20868]
MPSFVVALTLVVLPLLANSQNIPPTLSIIDLSQQLNPNPDLIPLPVVINPIEVTTTSSTSSTTSTTSTTDTSITSSSSTLTSITTNSITFITPITYTPPTTSTTSRITFITPITYTEPPASTSTTVQPPVRNSTMATRERTSMVPVGPTTTMPVTPVQTGGVDGKTKNSVEMIVVLLGAAAGFFVFA